VGFTLSSVRTVNRLHSRTVDTGRRSVLRGQPVGARHDQLSCYLLRGSFAISSGLEAFYAGRGFDILSAGASISLEIRLGQPVQIGTQPSEQLFARSSAGGDLTAPAPPRRANPSHRTPVIPRESIDGLATGGSARRSPGNALRDAGPGMIWCSPRHR